MLFGNPETRDHMGNLGTDGRTTLKWILKKTGFIWLRIG
jgi:hypothetical protein